MSRYLLSLVCCAVLIAFVRGDNPYPTAVPRYGDFPSGTTGNGTIFYQRTNYINFGNVKNPVTISISYSDGANYPASICFNPFQQELTVPGVNLESNCPAGAFGVVSNKTMLNGTDFEDTPDGATKDTQSVDLWLRPAPNAGFIVTLPDSVDLQQFTLFWEAEQCESADLFPVGSNSQCVTIPDLSEGSRMISVGAGTWSFFRINVPAYAAANNNFTVSVNGTNDAISMFLQEGYVPSAEWFVETEDDTSTTNILRSTVLTPGTWKEGSTYYVGIHNDDDQVHQVQVNMTYGACSNSNFGFNCTNNPSNTSSPVGGFLPITATLTPGPASSLAVNNGSAWGFDFSDDDYEHHYAYFKLTDYPDYTLPYVIRVSVGNNDVNSLDGAPSIYAKLGGYPSAQSCFYNSSNAGDVVHQLALPINKDVYNNGKINEDNTWYIAVKLPVDFSIWVGVNCANGCDDDKHGKCMCNDFECNYLTKNGTTNLETYYQLPSSLEDSAGACTCSDKRYAYSFDCSAKDSGNSALYILLIAIGGVLVLCIAIAVPLYCGLANKKANSYDKI